MTHFLNAIDAGQYDLHIAGALLVCGAFAWFAIMHRGES